MSHHDIPDLDTKGLRQFGLILASVLGVIPGLLLPWRWSWERFPNYYWITVGVLVALWALLAPNSMRGMYNAWMRVALVIGNIVNHIVLAIVFYLVIFPLAVMMRLVGKDPMHRALDPKAASYRVASKVAQKNHVERPF